MGEQLSLISTDIDPNASIEPCEVPKAARRKRSKEIWPQDQELKPNDSVVLLSRLGAQQEVRFCRLLSVKIAQVKWPTANDVLEIGLSDGRVKVRGKKRQHLREWQLEPGALRAMRKLAEKMPDAGKAIAWQDEDSNS